MADMQQILRSIVPEVQQNKRIFDDTKTTVAVILDEFSTDCFAPEVNLVPLGTHDFHRALDHFKPEFFLCESSWRGNNNLWIEEIAGTGSIKPRLKALLDACRERGIPTVFWNKEDPPHFDEFIGSAKHFDIIFTTEERMIPKYIAACGHERIHVLPFAAQPILHNPLQVTNFREREVAFAGQYFAHKFPERREQTEFLFDAAKHFDFHIHSREQTGDSRYRFPSEYSSFIRGSLAYEKMVEAYKWYKVYLNVNSVHDSKTMCARRIFELSASKTIVLSAYTPAVATYYSDRAISPVSNSKEARTALDMLLNSDAERLKRAHRAWRETMQSHTYAHRLDTIKKACANFLGNTTYLSFIRDKIAVILDCKNYLNIDKLIQSLKNQSISFDFIIPLNSSIQLNRKLARSFNTLDIKIIKFEDVDKHNIDAFVTLKAGYEYGFYYLEDLLHYFQSTNVEIVAKPIDVKPWTSKEIEGKFDFITNKVASAGYAFRNLQAVERVILSGELNTDFDILEYPEIYVADPYNIKPEMIHVEQNEWNF